MTKAKIAFVYYSMYGHIKQLVDKAVEGVKATGATVTVYQFAETLPQEVLAKMHAAPKHNEFPVIKPDDLKQYDGIVFAFPTRYGRAVAQASAFFDSCGGLWGTQAINGKMATIITSTATQHGGHEATHLTTIPFLAHHGVIYVPIGYKSPILTKMGEITGGSPYGASTMAGSDGSRQPSADELELAHFHGQHFAEIVNKYVS